MMSFISLKMTRVKSCYLKVFIISDRSKKLSRQVSLLLCKKIDNILYVCYNSTSLFFKWK